MLANLTQLLGPARTGGYGVPAFNVYGYEDARAVVDAVEELEAPVVLGASMTLLSFIPLDVVAFMLTDMARRATVPVCVHLDHGKDMELIAAAIDRGFSSVMFDGSDLSIEDNIERARNVVRHAHARGVSVEVEVGTVPEAEDLDGAATSLTDPEEAARLVEVSGADALAVSVGNAHHMLEPNARIDFSRVEEIASAVEVPLVMHGTSGIPVLDLPRLAATSVSKFNIGTALRRALGGGLRRTFAADPHIFDRVVLMRGAMEDVKREAQRFVGFLGAERRANPAPSDD